MRREERVNPSYYVEGSTNWRTNRKTAHFTSASVTTEQKTSWTYGRFEIRAKVDTSPGMWPAFWASWDIIPLVAVKRSALSR